MPRFGAEPIASAHADERPSNVIEDLPSSAATTASPPNRSSVHAELVTSVALARLQNAAIADAMPAVDGRDVEPNHRRVAMPHFTESCATGREAVRSRLRG